MDKINTYHLELDADQHPVLVVKEKFLYESTSVCSPQDAVDLVNKIFKLNKLAEEYAIMLALNAKGKMLGIFEVSHGTVSSTSCNNREIFIRALVVGASGVIILHNHPSGVVTPSSCDHDVAKKIKEAGKLMGIELMDFIIVGDAGYLSFNEEKII
jgi:DNA repair protein RadC